MQPDNTLFETKLKIGIVRELLKQELISKSEADKIVEIINRKSVGETYAH